MTNPYFTLQGISFLDQLAKNNNRDWFEENKPDYEVLVRTPALQFIEDMASEISHLSPHFLAIAKKTGGSLMRVYRDVRFSKDKSPYKTNIGIQFRHDMGKDVHAPGFYVHIEPGECFVGVGIWKPDSPTLTKIRDAIIEQDKKWMSAINSNSFKKHFELRGDALKNPPRGYDKEHPFIEDLKRKDFIAISPVTDKEVLSDDFKQLVIKRFTDAEYYMQFLCEALMLRY